MNKSKLVSVVILLMTIFICEKSFSQTQEKQDQQTQQTDPVADPNTDSQFNSDPTQSDPNTVTIDSTGTGSSYDTTTPATGTYDAKPAEKIRLYSGKHDGNNVINPDPKKD
ncbi:MAG: hypothetical protein ACHQNT_04635 [Bacteroidia bacterium]